jgi:hypothetical protein
MSYKLSWFIPGRVIDMVLPVHSNDEALMQALDAEMIGMLDIASQPVNILIDLRTMKEFPSASVAMKMRYYKHQNTGRLIVIGMTANPMLRFLGGLVGRGVGIQIKDFGTREEALAYLETVERA